MPYDTPMLDTTTPAVAIEDKAKDMVLEIKSQEPDADDLGLVLSIAGIDGDAFRYDVAMIRVAEAAPDDHIVDHGDLTIVIPAADLENLRGATIKMSTNLLEPGLVLDNPNSPSPQILGGGAQADLSGSVAERVVQVLDTMINPAIAAHGGRADVVAGEDSTVYVRLGGGCQGCGMASVTLSQGIEATLIQMVPEIVKVIDVTEHADGSNPYYEQAKK